ncbi:hypothetical protein GQ44DRAFT_326226 [Phaeosphaeriaceae sp. PMI808]|nr:hypothetical protein GQ44DRAFT_326226 [Phaeosphaeriaceae sp. PMI808]
MPKSSTLSLAMRGKAGKDIANGPMSPQSPKSPGHFSGADLASPNAPFQHQPDSPASPKPRKETKNIFSNFSGNKSSSRMFHHDNSSRHLTEAQPSPVYSNGRGGTSTPDLNRPVQTPTSDDHRSEIERLDHRTGSGNLNDYSENADPSQRNTTKSKKGGMLGRTRSIKGEESSGARTKLNKAPPPQLSPEIAGTWTTSGDGSSFGSSLRTAPLDKGQSWRSRVGGQSKLRTHSADGHDSTHRDEDHHHGSRRDRAEQNSQAGSSYNEHKGGAFMFNLRSGARDVGGKLGSAKKGIFQKLGRSSSSHETPTMTTTTNEPYVFKVIHQPLVEQTRATRISTRLEQSRDKTEFWMPSLPWRCIDYLNMRGCEEEGLYRVPGSAQQVKYYERKFDTDGDIDLISDPNLNDPNVIGSLFKGWLRQLPDDIFPKEIQARIQQQCQGAKATPQMLKDELSRLPPYNYYLLFAITCHISLLHSCSEFNKMNYNNLCICFQPAIRIDAFCFQFLILDWRNCWQGCWTEKDYLGEELAYLQSLQPQSQQPMPAHPSNTNTSQVNHVQQTTGKRSGSVDRNGRIASPATFGRDSSRHLDRDSSTERTISSSGSREVPNTHGTPKRAQPSVSTDVPSGGDDAATPTQATLHNRGPSDSTQFRLDLSNPPSSPFNIKF